MTLQELENAIKAKLELRKGDGQPLVDVFDEHRTDLPGYPCVTFEWSGKEGDFETTEQNSRIYTYEIYVHQEMESGGRRNAIATLNDVVQTLIDDFENDWQLGGVADYCATMPVERGVYNEGAGEVMYAVLKLSCTKSITVTT